MSTSQPERLRTPATRTYWPLLLLLLLSAPAEAAVTEHWYLFRARSNMEIKNYRAAIEAYRKVLIDDPEHREALRGLGVACEANGQTDEAIAAYDKYLARYPDDPEVALRQAHFLGWSRYAYRRADAVKYYRISLKHRDDPAERVKLARLLAEDEATLAEALEEYRRLMKQRPEDQKLRAEYQKLLLWDEAHLDEAIRAYAELARERPSDREVGLQYARLLARHPKRHREASKQYRTLLGSQPKNRSLRLEYARVLTRDPGSRAEAREQLKLAHASGKWKFEDRLLYADLLAADEEHHVEAIHEYGVLSQQAPKNSALRVKRARLLGSKLETNDQAIEEYEAILEREPENGQAHRGLAHAYAWKGDSDRALHHEQRAKELGAEDESLQSLSRDLSCGREPRIGGGVSMVLQPSTQFPLYGLRLPLQGHTDASPFVTTRAQAGFETYWGSGSPASGAFVSASSEIRMSREQKLELELGYQSVRAGLEGLRGLVAFEHAGESVRIRPHFERRPREDSFRALVGTSAVSSNLAGVRFLRESDATRIWATPQVGFVAGGSAAANFMASVDATAEWQAIESAPIELWLGLDSRAVHHGSDASSVYFSPALHAVGVPRLTFRHVVERAHFFEASAGPSLQYQVPQSGGGQFIVGAEARVNGGFRLSEGLEAGFGAAFTRVGDAYLRVDCGGSMSYLF